MSEKRTITVNGSVFTLPKLWKDEDIDSLMNDFKEASNEYVSITLDNGVVQVLVNDATQVRFEVLAVKPRGPVRIL